MGQLGPPGHRPAKPVGNPAGFVHGSGASPLDRAREPEALAWLNISLRGTLGIGWRIGRKLVGVPTGVLKRAP
jgi:hypothetical protein